MCHIRLFEWQACSYEAFADQIPALTGYLSDVWQNRKRYVHTEEVSEEEQQEERIQKQRFFDFTINGEVSARNFVGVVQFEGIRLEVYPKIFSGDQVQNAHQWQTNLLYWLSYCSRIKFPFSSASVEKLPFDDFLELLIYLFANYTVGLISNQPFHAYHTVEEETAFLKGRLLFDDYVANNLVKGRWQHFYCAHEPFVYDNQFNRIIKYVTRRLAQVSKKPGNIETLNEILFVLDEVSDVTCTAADCDKIKLNPLYEDHQQLLRLCKLYLSHQMIDLSAENSENFCFLVPMEYVFEDFVFGFIRDNWKLPIQAQSRGYLARNRDRQVFQIKNDLYVPDRLIIDTKYKIRSVNDDLKAGVAQSDLYQMVSYAIARNCTNVLMLYPGVAGASAEDVIFDIPSAMLSKKITIEVRYLDITFTDIRAAEGLIKDRVKRLHAVFE